MNEPYWQNPKANVAAEASVAQGLQQFMTQTFTWMALGLGITGFVAVLTASSESLMALIFGSPLFIFLIIAELGLVIAFGFMMRKNVSSAVLLGMFLAYSALNGLTLSSIFLVYQLGSISQAFFVSAGMFGAMSVYGYVTKRDLTAMGSFMFMGLIGIIIASVINLFFASSFLNLLISAVGVFIFVGLTAYDTQKLKAYYASHAGDEALLKKLALGGALSLYLDFINLFLFILRLLGNRR